MSVKAQKALCFKDDRRRDVHHIKGFADTFRRGMGGDAMRLRIPLVRWDIPSFQIPLKQGAVNACQCFLHVLRLHPAIGDG